MKFVNKETGLQLIISEELVLKIAGYGINNYPKEFGGLLLGRYTSDNKVVIVEDIILPQKYKSSKYCFERGSEGLKEILELKYNASPSLIYVGEWHTHPDGPADPSRTDIKAMSELANDKNVLITNPVLMILEIRKKDYKMALYFYYTNKLLQYHLSDKRKETIIREDSIDFPIKME
ncbi:Mov34/MPN/PAD-1 family protein [Paraflavitalea speifideaquila]|uniref:Mov34/MPN/PAD-1 family protein n=1 Tax=Paraflavitalea speifideaquila TaxID=3076558 RepID=UPI0028ED7F70|nr:Mov34/MPN/PAD-1 family protein [Paraflavitalea speifideiaquila]